MTRASLTVAALLVASTAVRADMVIAESNTLAYSGGWTKYSTLTDATNGMNAMGFGVVPTRDAVLTVYKGITTGPDAGPDFVALVTRFADPAVGNGNNQFLGFFQYTNQLSPNAGTSAIWTNAALTSFQVGIGGGNPVTSDDQRFGVSGADAGIGLFRDFAANFTFTGVTPNGIDPNAGFTGTGYTGVTGTATGLFENAGGGADAGFYRFNLTFQSGPALNSPDSEVNRFATANAIPAPPAAVLAGIALGLGGLVRLRRRKAADVTPAA